MEPIQSRNQESLGGAFDAGWELDLFGGVHRFREAALADLQAEVANLADVLISLTAEIGLNYIDLRTYQARLNVARPTWTRSRKPMNSSRAVTPLA